MLSLGEKLLSRGDGIFVTMEISPPNIGDVGDNERFQRHLSRVRELLSHDLIDGFTTNSLPQFTPKEIKDIREMAPAFLELIGCDADTIEAILMEVTRRTSSMDLAHLGELEKFHTPTLAIQNNFPSSIRKKVSEKAFESRSIFVVSGGHPLRKLITLLDHKFPLAGRLAKLAFVYNYDSSKATKDLRTHRPDVTSIFGAWNPALDKIHSVERKAQSGMNGLLTQPASFLPQLFTRALQELRNNEHTKNLRVQIGIPFIGSSKALKKWFFLMGISPETHLEAGFLLESFERAERDGRLTFFADTWTRNCLEWALSLAGGDGVHYMPHALNERTAGILMDARGGQHSTGMDILLASKQTLIDWQIRYDALAPRVGLNYLSGMLESSPKKDYAEEFLPLIEPAYEIIQELQTSHPKNSLWTNFSVNFIRMPQNNHAHTLPVELIANENKTLKELVIDIRYPGYKTNLDLFKKRLRNTLLAELEGKPVDHHVYLGERANPPFLYDVLDEGWNEFSHAQTAENKPDVGTSIAKDSIVYERSAQELYESLKNAGDREEYAVAELGVYDANGMPEMLGHLQKLINKDKTNRVMLLERLKRTVFVCVDFAKDGLDSCQKVLAIHPKLTGMFREFKYIEGNIMDEKCHDQLNPWKGKFLSIRAINTLCAFPEPSYVVRHNTPYRVEYDTLIDTIELQKLVKDLYPPAVLEPGKKSNHLIYSINKKEQPPLAEGIVTQEFILNALQKAQKVQKNKIGTFTQFLMDKAHIPREAALLIWVRVLHILKKKKRFVSIDDPDEVQHARDVASHHPDTHVPFTLSHHATRFMSHLGSFLDPKSGTAFFASLMSDLSSQYLASHQASHGPATPGITGSQPVQPEPIVTSFTSNGLKLQVIPHRDHPKRTKEKQLRPTVSMMLVKHVA